MDREAYLKQELQTIGIEINDHQVQQFMKYYDMVLQKNMVMNLTAITEYTEFVKKHFVDSLMIFRQKAPKAGMCMIDIGTGAGFPGIPIKIAYPEVSMVLLDSLNKRVLFLQDVIHELGLQDIIAIHERAEGPAHQGEYRESFDICVSRAVANLTTLVEYCLPYVKVSGEFISYKSGKITDELLNAEYAIKVLGGKVDVVESFELPGSDMERTLVHIKKVKHTPKKYPRSAGKPSKEPLRPDENRLQK